MTPFWTCNRAALGALMLGALGTGQAHTLLLDAAALDDAPRVVASVDHRLLLGPGDTVEVRGPHTERLLPGQRYRLVRWRPPHRPQTDAPAGPLWVHAVAHARVERSHTIDAHTAAAWLRIEDASDAVRLGDWVWWWPEDGAAP